MDEGDIALAIAEQLLRAGYKALGFDIGEVIAINAQGQRFVLEVTTVDGFGDYGCDDSDLSEGDFA